VNGVWPILAAVYLGHRVLAGLPVFLQLMLS